ncbi:MAG TPA: hemolysin family protein [Terriglobia bacterium]|nr:hemolysin family protein [Terriglobia bacterium]
MSSLVLIPPLLLFFGLSAFFSLSETAILSSNRYKIRHLALQGNRHAAKLASWLDAPDTLLATILLWNNFGNVGAATLGAALVSRIVDSPRRLDIALAIEAVALTAFLLLFCELGPKAFAARYPERVALRVVAPVEFCIRLTYPITRLGLSISGFFFRASKTAPAALTAGVTTDELRALVSGVSHERIKIVERVLEFSERQVKDVMVPRLEVTALEASASFEEILMVVENTRYSRFPVYQNVLDNVIGILHAKDLMPFLRYPKTFRLTQSLRKPVFIPDTVPLDNSVEMLQNAQTHLGVVVDEHGGVEGIVTLEDLIEQIVGEIQDEHDVEVDSVIPHYDGSAMIDGSVPVRELNERLSLSLPETNQYVTLAGFLMAQSGRLPHEGDEIGFQDRVFRVEHMVGRRIHRVRLLKPGSSPRSGRESRQHA